MVWEKVAAIDGQSMIIKFIEATNGTNWGKFLLIRFGEAEWKMQGQFSEGRPLLHTLGWSPDHLWVLDLQTGEGAFFRPGGFAAADLEKHKIWVCPLYEPFLVWLYKQKLTDILALPDKVELPNAPAALWGYRRKGPE